METRIAKGGTPLPSHLRASRKASEKKSFLWDEENRLLAVNNNGSVSCYFYDAAGERTVKLTSESEMVHVNGKKVGGNANICKFTAYVSPYFMVSNGGAYTKHIYAADQRIASKLGNIDGFGADPRRVEQAGGKKYDDNQSGTIKARFEALNIDYSDGNGKKDDEEYEPTMDSEEKENLVFFYHPDHLGSTSYVTDADGNIAQHIEYIPYGEVFVEERNSQFSTNYLFNAKELDNETGLYYYGARYLDPTGGMWLSVDPMWEKYAGMSPYNYCMGNPVKLVDPDGRDVALMIAPEGAGELGHMAAIIQKSDGTCYYMTAGADEEGTLRMLTIGCKGGVVLKPVPKEFLRDEEGNIMCDIDGWPLGMSYCNDVNEAFEKVRSLDNNNSEYTDYVTIKTTKEQDKKIFRNAKSIQKDINKGKTNYHLLFNNCSEIVISCVENGTDIDIKDGFTPVPNGKFDNIKNPFDIKKMVKSMYDDIKNYFNEEN